MKKILLLSIMLSLVVFSKMPEEVKQEIKNDARSIYDEDKEQRHIYIKWQEDSYNEIEEKEKEAGLSSEEYRKLKKELQDKYGRNFVKQNIEINELIKREKKIKIEVEKKIGMKLSENKKINELEKGQNIKSKAEIEELVKSDSIPKEIMNHFEKEAKKLYPGNFYEQKKYLESSISNYHFIKNIK